MTTPAQLRDQALALPEVQEGTHFRLPAYRVGDAVFLVLQSDEYAVLHVDADTAATAANAFASIEETYRGRTLIGIRAHLPELSPDDLRPHSLPPGGTVHRGRCSHDTRSDGPR